MVFFAPNQFPRAIFPREFAHYLIGAVVRLKPAIEVIRVSDIELAGRVLEYVHPIHNRFAKWLQRQGSNLQPAG